MARLYSLLEARVHQEVPENHYLRKFAAIADVNIHSYEALVGKLLGCSLRTEPATIEQSLTGTNITNLRQNPLSRKAKVKFEGMFAVGIPHEYMFPIERFPDREFQSRA
ncbi:MAG: hypothetical protein BRC44_10410 [Cyanobacteria bacterium QS_4_48_99]|nr:MAG: hypothetical protein BRC44_10410 [Cyanobacteria bacterium QS_4_48_99]PSO82284.1 MAG: hypothetical protein BRC45_09855 [Cyanobacteria bacterium QS_5_48_63]